MIFRLGREVVARRGGICAGEETVSSRDLFLRYSIPWTGPQIGSIAFWSFMGFIAVMWCWGEVLVMISCRTLGGMSLIVFRSILADGEVLSGTLSSRATGCSAGAGREEV